VVRTFPAVASLAGTTRGAPNPPQLLQVTWFACDASLLFRLLKMRHPLLTVQHCVEGSGSQE
jgi:hypothetical protein